VLAIASFGRYYPQSSAVRINGLIVIVILTGAKAMKSEKKKSQVAVVMGSDSDLAVMQSCIDQLADFGIEPVVRIISAHRTPQIAADFAAGAVENGIEIIIAAAGMAAHLAGALAARTTLPIIGVPIAASESPAGLDALLSTVQMPPGVPVATVAIGKPGAKNAAILAVQILALADKPLAKKLADFKKAQTQKVIQKDSSLSS
jgi:phosphoribosylaminoimidazole carboxylase PurE protein